ncbi:MAG: ABC transporter ATP-binding protein [Caldilineaceae bacterium]|nr:ABC transporter ATP-binding protein [Caldilineaceae bacterium]
MSEQQKGARAKPSQSTDTAIEVIDLVKNYDDVEALKKVTLQVQKGEIFALLGPNGAGKTTLFSILATIRRPTSGTAKVFDMDVTEQKLAVRKRIGIVFQEPALDEQISAQDNLELMGLFYGLSRRRARARAGEVLGDLAMSDLADRAPEKLSGGQKRKLELARAIIASPDLLFLDEATLGLDVNARHSFWETVTQLAANGTTVFLTTHYMQEAAIAHRIALMTAGEIVALDTPDGLRSQVGEGLVHLDTEDNTKARQWLQEHEFRIQDMQQEGIFIISEQPQRVLSQVLKGLPTTVTRAEIREPSLDDAFLKLTGQTLDESQVEQSPNGKLGGNANGNERDS